MLCRFYQRGCCKFGENCRYVHEDSDQDCYHNSKSAGSKRFNRGGGYSSNQRSNYYQGQGDNKYLSGAKFRAGGDRRSDVTTNVSDAVSVPEQHMAVLLADMKEWSHSNMWKLSCYGFMKNARHLPGLEEYSFEEIRLACYEAGMNNKYGSYLSWLHGILKKNSIFINQFCNLTASQRETLLITVHQYIKDAEEREVHSSSHPQVHGPTSQAHMFGAFETSSQGIQQPNIFVEQSLLSNIQSHATNVFQHNPLQSVNIQQQPFHMNSLEEVNVFQTHQPVFQQHLQQQPFFQNQFLQNLNLFQQNLFPIQNSHQETAQPQMIKQKQSHPFGLSSSHVNNFGPLNQEQKRKSPINAQTYSDARLLSTEDVKQFESTSFTYIPAAAPFHELV